MLTHSRAVVLWTFLNLLSPRDQLVSEAQSIQDDTTWQQYVRAPPSRTVKPQAVLSQYTAGNVTNPEGLLDGSSTTYLTRPSNSSDAPVLVVDFGQNVVGLLSITFAGATTLADGYPGVTLIFSETLEYLTTRSDFTRSDNAQTTDQKLVPSATDQIAVKPDPYTWLDQWGCEFGNQVCSDGLHGFRYVKIQLDAVSTDSPNTVAEGSVAISSISLEFSGFLGTPDTFTGWFECSDTDLTQWWFDGAYTTDMCTDTFFANDTEPRNAASASLLGKTVLLDGAKRDRDPYVGDLAVSALTSFLTHDAQEASRNVLEDLILHQRSDGWIPPASINDYSLQLFDYPLWWVSCSWDYVYYSGNLSYIQTYYTNLQSVLDVYYTAHTATDSALLVRQDGYGDFAFINRPGSAAYYSALYVLALNRAADLADVLSESSDATRWRQRAANVSTSFVAELWDPSVSAFFDRKCTGSGCTAHAQDGNSLAILAGVVAGNSTQAQSALSYLSNATAHPYGNSFYDAAGEEIGEGYSDRVYAFISYLEIAARFVAGDPASALDQIRRMYGWMASNDPGVTQWEGIGANGSMYEGGFTSAAHGWSTGIVPLLTNYVLGVTPTRPGFQQWSVRPVTGDLTSAKGVVPTPHGGLGVSWQTGATGIQITVDAPTGTNGTVDVPGAASGSVTVDGVSVWDGTAAAGSGAAYADGYVVVPLQGGDEHVVAYTAAA